MTWPWELTHAELLNALYRAHPGHPNGSWLRWQGLRAELARRLLSAPEPHTKVTAQMVSALRALTGGSMRDCKKALALNGGDQAKAAAWLRDEGNA